MTDPDPDLLDALAAEFMERQRRGDSPSIEEYATQHPDLADEIRELFPAIGAMEQLKARGEQTTGGRASLGPVKLERLGDYHILREIGRGGMGIVYEAEQESLHRRVAIKVLPRQSLLEPTYLRRFERESRVAANLHHTNIVPVFGVGEQDGYHYYVMQFIPGVGLDVLVTQLAEARRQGQHADVSDLGGIAASLLSDDAVGSGSHVTALAQTDPPPRRLPSGGGRSATTIVAEVCDDDESPSRDEAPPPDADEPTPPTHHPGRNWRALADIVFQAADALHYAHTQGALHRDIKPANLLVDTHGVVWITDFGLAKALHADDVTGSGAITGTLRYMAPEQLRGHAGVRSDVYSLGLTLYELIALRPAYEAATPTDLMEQISRGGAPRPRSADPNVPRDLETVVLKATAGDPHRRYRTAAEFADDLRRFIEDRPILARRIGPLERLWRWSRRNPAVASLGAATLALSILVAAVASTGYIRTKRALAGQAAQRKRAEATSAVAQEALDRIFERLGPVRTVRTSELTVEGAGGTTIELPTPPTLSKDTAALLGDMLSFYNRLAAQPGEDAAVREKAAQANRRLGDIRQRLGQYEAALEAYARAIAICDQLPEDAGHQAQVARLHNELGHVYRMTQQSAKARDSHQAALTALEGIKGDAASAAGVRYELARAYFFLANRQRPAPGAGPHPAHHRPPRPGREGQKGSRPPGPPGMPPPEPQDRRQDGAPGGLLPREARAALDTAISLLHELREQYPGNPNYRHLLARCYREQSQHPNTEGHEAASTSLEKAIASLEELVRDFPSVPDYRYDLSETLAAIDPVRRPTAFLTDWDIEGRLRRALDVSQGLVADFPNIPHYLGSQAHIQHKLGLVLERLDRIGDAVETHQRAIDVQQELVDRLPTAYYHQVWLGQFRHSLARLLMRRDELEEARSRLDQSIAELTALLEKQPDMWYIHGLLAQDYRLSADILRREGDTDRSRSAAQRAEEYRKKLAAESQQRAEPGVDVRRN